MFVFVPSAVHGMLRRPPPAVAMGRSAYSQVIRTTLYEACQSVRNRFVVTGAPGSGKTPILRELVRLGFIGVNEPARDIL
ncbi:MAG TPA: hypothetical protein VJ755_07970, partial [Gemmatimonadales bacterium]|nr:hypothetical protein [Gemmatimonadales bacterium]